jgi:hypothetical protein
MFTAAQRSALPAYPPARGCDAHLNAWCDANCPHHEAHGALLARYAHSSAGPVKSWRCFARSSLEEDAQTYKAGTRTYCTRNAQLWEQLAHCRDNPPPSPPPPPPQVDVAVKPSGEASMRPQPSPKPAARSAGPAAEAWIDGPQPVPLGWRGASSRPLSPAEAAAAPPHYEHDPELLSLSPRIPVPRREDCDYALAGPPTFVGISMYTDAYAHKAQYLLTSCVGVGVCCALSHVPNDAFGSDALAGAERQGKENQGKVRLLGCCLPRRLPMGRSTRAPPPPPPRTQVPNYFRHRLIASKPLFILEALRASALPVAWMDVDLEFHQPPLLFAPGSWGTARDVLLWNWHGGCGLKGRPPCSRTAAHEPAWCLLGPRPLLPTPERSLSRLKARCGRWSSPRLASEDEDPAHLPLDRQGNVSMFKGRRLKMASLPVERASAETAPHRPAWWLPRLGSLRLPPERSDCRRSAS